LSRLLYRFIMTVEATAFKHPRGGRGSTITATSERNASTAL
jgi:hypothetical protein